MADEPQDEDPDTDLVESDGNQVQNRRQTGMLLSRAGLQMVQALHDELKRRIDNKEFSKQLQLMSAKDLIIQIRGILSAMRAPQAPVQVNFEVPDRSKLLRASAINMTDYQRSRAQRAADREADGPRPA